MISANDVIEYYEYFYSKRFDSIKYKFKPSEKALKSISKFLELISEHYPTMGRKFLWRYFSFQFYYWDQLEVESFYGKYRVELIIGSKAFFRWKDRNKAFDDFIDDNDLGEKYGIRRGDLIPLIEKVPIRFPYEEDIKKTYFGTDKGFATCLQFTTLYDDQHQTCLKCPFKEECKKILKKNYLKLYEGRGYSTT